MFWHQHRVLHRATNVYHRVCLKEREREFDRERESTIVRVTKGNIYNDVDTCIDYL